MQVILKERRYALKVRNNNEEYVKMGLMNTL